MPLIFTRGAASAKGFGFTGGVPLPWINLQTGDSYLGGVVVRYSTTIAVRWYPASRVTLGVQSNPTTLSTTQTIPVGVTSVSLYGVGGGGGGTGSNTCGGGGGGAFAVTGVAVSPGTSFTVNAGNGGKGGVNSTKTDWNVPYMGNYPTDSGGESGQNSSINISGVISLRAQGGTAGNTAVANPTSYSDTGVGGVGQVLSNPGGYSVTIGTGGNGGSRNLAGTNGSSGGGGGGGGNDSGPPSSPTNYDRGGNGSGRFGGGAGGGNAPGNYALRTGGTGGSEAGSGGLGGSTDSPGSTGTFGLNGNYYAGQSAVANAGGRAYIETDGTTLFPSGAGNFNKGSAAGGGFPGGGGGSSYYNGGPTPRDSGPGGDGASGMIQMEWALP